MKKNILVSACLLGTACRYDGKSVPSSILLSLKEQYNMIPVCPEIFGGLPTPRDPSERIGNQVIQNTGNNVTKEYMLGAQMTLELAKEHQVEFCILKARSPSCGMGKIYDGTFSGTLKDGNGVTVELLLENGYTIYDENTIKELL